VPGESTYSYRDLLSQVEPRRFKKLEGQKTLSEIFTVSDEAFGLLVIHNNLDTWRKQHEMKKNGSPTKKQLRDVNKDTPKKYTNHLAGRTWSNEGLLMYDITRVQVEERRRSVENKQLEERLIMQDSQDPTQSSEEIEAMEAYLAEHNIDTFVDC